MAKPGTLSALRTFLMISAGAPLAFFVHDSFDASKAFLSVVNLLYMSIWTAGFSLDVWTTHRFFDADRDNFSASESNAVFSKLVERFGFTKGLAIQLTIIEIPAALALAFLLYPVYRDVFAEIDSNGAAADFNLVFLLPCLPSALFLFGAIHMIDAFVNLSVEREEMQSRVNRGWQPKDN